MSDLEERVLFLRRHFDISEGEALICLGIKKKFWDEYWGKEPYGHFIREMRFRKDAANRLYLVISLCQPAPDQLRLPDVFEGRQVRYVRA